MQSPLYALIPWIPVLVARVAAVVGALTLVAPIALGVGAHAVGPALAAGLGLVVFVWSARADVAIERGRDRLFEGLRDRLDALARNPRTVVTAQAPSRRG